MVLYSSRLSQEAGDKFCGECTATSSVAISAVKHPEDRKTVPTSVLQLVLVDDAPPAVLLRRVDSSRQVAPGEVVVVPPFAPVIVVKGRVQAARSGAEASFRA